jgi:zinc transport system ATP-binding protein
MTPQPAISYSGVTYRYPRRGRGDAPLTALEDVTLTVMERDCLGILGPNGGGKTTLLKLTLGLLPTQAGRISIFGQTPAEACRRGIIGYVPQRTESELSFPLTVRQVIEMSASWRLVPWRGLDKAAAKHIDEVMSLLGIAELADRPIGGLSGGQVQRAMIARALAPSPRILLLDEPTVGVDIAGQQRFASLIGALRDRFGVTIVMVTHSLRTLAAGCERVACLSRRLHSHGTPAGLTPAVLAEVFQHDVAAIFGDVHVDAHHASQCDDPAHHHHGEHGAAKPVVVPITLPRDAGA